MPDVDRMDVHETLVEVRAQKERLEEEICTKTDLCSKLKKAQHDLITKLQEAKLQSEKQAQELSAKSEELSTIHQIHQDLKSSFQERESSLKHLNSALEKLRYEYGEKIQKLEGENKDLILFLEKSTTTSQSLKSKLDSSNMEIENLKGIILLKDKKILEVSDKARTTKDLIQRDEVISNLEEKRRDVEDQLKWKNEQFQHLEEAHKKLQANFKSCKAEWEREISLLLEEICSVQSSLDSQTRISENLQTQLKICNQVLAHEESNKKLLEIEVSEYKSRFENIYSECYEAKATIEKLSHKRDEEVAELRDSLAAKDSLVNEMGYKMVHLEQENKDLIASVKEFQEFQISNCGNTGLLKKLQKKYQGLEQVHKKCGQNLKEKEVEWKFELEKVRKEMDEYLSKLKVQSEQIRVLESFRNQDDKNDSEDLSQKFLELEKQKLFVERQNMQLETNLEACKLENQILVFKANEQNNKIVDLQQQLVLLETLVTERKETIKAQKNLLVVSEQEKTSLLQVIEEKNQRIEELVEQSKALEKEVTNALMISEGKQIEIDVMHQALHQFENEGFSQKFRTESQNMQLETENRILFSKANEQNEKNVDLQQEIVLLETLVTERNETIEAYIKDKEKYFKIIEDKEGSIKRLLQVIEEGKQRIEELVEESKALEKEVTNALLISEGKQIEIDVIHQALHQFENEGLSQKFVTESQNMQLETENRILFSKANEQNEKNVDLQQEIVLLETLVTERNETIEAYIKDKEKYFKIIEDKESSIKRLLQVIEEGKQRIEELVEESKALEKETINALMIVEEKQIEIDVMHQALLKLENEVSDLCQKINVKDESLLQSSQHVEELEVMLKINKLEIDNLKEQFGEVMKEMTNALVISEEKQIEIDVKQEALHKLENEVSDLCEKLRIKDESLLQSSQHAEEIESLLQISKLEKENLKEEFGDEKLRLENLVMKLEVKNRDLHEDIEKQLFHREDLLIQMERTSKQMEEYSNKDAELMGMLENMLMLHKSDAKEGGVKLPFSPLHKGYDDTVDARLPLINLNK